MAKKEATDVGPVEAKTPGDLSEEEIARVRQERARQKMELLQRAMTQAGAAVQFVGLEYRGGQLRPVIAIVIDGVQFPLSSNP